MAKRTLQEILTYDSGLTIGAHPVDLVHRTGKVLRVRVHIPTQGRPQLVSVAKKADGGVYLNHYRVEGDSLVTDGNSWSPDAYWDEIVQAPADATVQLA